METNKKQSILKKWWFWSIIIILLIIGFNNVDNNFNVNNQVPDNLINEIDKIDNTDVSTIDNSEILKPSNDNYKKYVYEVFDTYYNEDYNFSGDESDWNIVNLENTELYRTKLEGIAIIENQKYNFYIILEFTDNTYSEYTVTNFELGNNKII